MNINFRCCPAVVPVSVVCLCYRKLFGGLIGNCAPVLTLHHAADSRVVWSSKRSHSDYNNSC